MLSAFYSFFFYASADPPHLHSFPTRRSSDLAASISMSAEGTVTQAAEGRLTLAVAKLTVFPMRLTLSKLARPLVVTVSFATDRKSTRLNSSHVRISYAVFCLKKKKNNSK